MRTPFMTITNSLDRTFAVRYVPAGARYGRASVLTNNSDDMVEFWDATYADDTGGDFTGNDGFGPLGQFVSRYFVSTIADDTGGLCLDGGNAATWSIDAAAMAIVREWLCNTRRALELVGA